MRRGSSAARSLLAAALAVSFVFVAAARAEPVSGAAALERITLLDGSVYQGELVEKVVGDHVTLKLATGAVKRFDWRSLRGEAAAPEPLAPEAATPPAAPAASAAPAENGFAEGSTPEPLEPPPPPEAPAGEAPPEEGLPPQSDPYGNTRFIPDAPRVVPTPSEYADGYSDGQAEDLRDWAWPRPLRLEGKRLYVGIGIGWDFPFAFPGDLVVGFEPAAWFGVEVAARYGNPFGPSVGELVRFALPLFNSGRIGIGTGLRQSFLVRAPGGPFFYAGAPSVAHFFDAELFGDTFFTKSLMLRTMVGFGTLLNGGAYDVMCSGLPYSDCSFLAPAGDPWAAAQGQRLFPYAKIQLIWHFGL